jgi:hypothetical protein
VVSDEIIKKKGLLYNQWRRQVMAKATANMTIRDRWANINMNMCNLN